MDIRKLAAFLAIPVVVFVAILMRHFVVAVVVLTGPWWASWLGRVSTENPDQVDGFVGTHARRHITRPRLRKVTTVLLLIPPLSVVLFIIKWF